MFHEIIINSRVAEEVEAEADIFVLYCNDNLFLHVHLVIGDVEVGTLNLLGGGYK